MRKIIKYGYLVMVHSLFYLVTGLFPKNKKLWVFGCWEGKIYADNAKYLFEWVNENREDIIPVWITKNQDVYKILEEKGYRVAKAGTLRSFFYLAKAAVVIETEGNADIGGFRPGRCRVVQLWHGVAPKEMKWVKQYGGFQTFLKKIVFDDHQKSYWMVSSERNKEDFQRFFGVDDDHIFITGYSRNDSLLNSSMKSNVIQLLEMNYPECKKIIYMPTHRNFGLDDEKFSLNKMKKVNRFLHINNYVLVFKPHFHELKKYLEIESELTNIVLAKDQGLYADVYSYLGGFDLLICDYSSVIYDYLCTKKPIVLFPYDIDSYKKNVGLFDCYESMPCGPFCYSWDEVLNEIRDIFKEDNWFERRERNRVTFHPHIDGKNSKRICDAINEILTRRGGRY